MVTKESIIFLTNTIGEINSFQKLNEGFQNIIYKIESQKGDYCLRVSKRNSTKHVQFEVDLLERLRNLPVIKLQSVEGKYIFTVNGKTAILYLYIDGKNEEINTIPELHMAGEFLADFHNQCHKVQCPKDHSQLYHLPMSVIHEYCEFIDTMKISHRELLPEIISGLQENILSDKQSNGPIHVDFGPKNALWKNGELVAVLDFDNAYNGPYILDVGKSIMFFASHGGGFEVSKAKAFFDGYISKRPLLVTEKEEIYKAIKFAFLSHIFVDYYMYAKKVTTEEYFDYIINDLLFSYRSFLLQLDLDTDFLYN